MPCDYVVTAAERARAIAELEEKLRLEQAQLEFDELSQRIIINNWTDEERNGYCDQCAIQSLKEKDSMIFQEKIAQLQATKGLTLTF